VDWIQLAQYRDQWRVLVNTAINSSGGFLGVYGVTDQKTST
jgi:hypothetical protein